MGTVRSQYDFMPVGNYWNCIGFIICLNFLMTWQMQNITKLSFIYVMWMFTFQFMQFGRAKFTNELYSIRYRVLNLYLKICYLYIKYISFGAIFICTSWTFFLLIFFISFRHTVFSHFKTNDQCMVLSFINPQTGNIQSLPVTFTHI